MNKVAFPNKNAVRYAGRFFLYPDIVLNIYPINNHDIELSMSAYSQFIEIKIKSRIIYA